MGWTTRLDLHRIAAHVLGRRRYAVSGHFGLRASPGGISTPAFGPEPETLRLTPACLVREVGSESRGLALAGATLGRAGGVRGRGPGCRVLGRGRHAGAGAGRRAARARREELDELFSWFDLGWRVLDEVMAERTGECVAATIQLWPEHFDVGHVAGRSGPATG